MRATWLAILLALLCAARAEACSIRDLATEEEKFARAKEVFLARVVRVEETGKAERIGGGEVRTVQGTYELVETFKGEPKDGDTVLDFVFNPGNCSLGIMAGLYYVFFVLPENRLVLWVNGSRGYINLDGSTPKADFERFRALARKAPPR
jgi:hypothetical protein